MKALRKALSSFLLAGWTMAGAAHAQLLPEPRPVLEPLKEPAPLLKGIAPAPRGYAVNEAFHQNEKLFKGLFKTDPRLLFGVALAPGLSLEGGYQHLLDQGFHRVDERDAWDTDGALFARSYSTHAGLKYTVPLNERLSVWGKLGRAYSAVPDPKLPDRDANPMKLPTRDAGRFVGVGANYKVDERTTIDARVGSHGDTAKKFGNRTNASGVRANLKMGF